MPDIETGHKAAIFIKQMKATGSGYYGAGEVIEGIVPLGTDATEIGGVPANKKSIDQLVVGSPSITLPIDNDPQEITQIGNRSIQKFSGSFKVDGRIEIWKSSGEWLGAVLGKADYESGSIKYLSGEEMPYFEIKVFMEVIDTVLTTLRGASPKVATLPNGAAQEFKELITLLKVKLTSYDRSVEANARVKETITYTAESMETTHY